MRDDHKYSVNRVVFYQHPNPGEPFLSYGENGPERTSGTILSVASADPNSWIYTVRNWYNGEIRQVSEEAIYCGANHTHRRGKGRASMMEAEGGRAEKSVLQSNLDSFVRHDIHRLKEAEDQKDAARKEGHDLPLEAGDYIRISGEFRKEIEPYHGFYAKILRVSPAEIGALELDPGKWAGARAHTVRKRYSVMAENRQELDIYDPEIKTYYTASGRSAILNWRAAIFLAELLGDSPPYDVNYDYLETHLFTRAELDGLSRPQLVEILIHLLYVKGQRGRQDLDSEQRSLLKAPDEYLVDNILFASRFDMRRNRPLTRQEIIERLKEQDRLRQLLGD